jgi:methyl-accepting chemotaxis protein PixJ
LKFFDVEASPLWRFVRRIVMDTEEVEKPKIFQEQPLRERENWREPENSRELENLQERENLREPKNSEYPRSLEGLSASFTDSSKHSQIRSDSIAETRKADSPTHSLTATGNTAMNLEQSRTRLNSKFPIASSPTPSSNHASNGNPSSSLEWMLSTANRMQQAETVDALYAITTTTVRQYLQADRVLVYHFQSESQGSVISEAVVDGYTPSLGESLPAIAFGAAKPSDYYQQSYVALHDSTQASLSPYQQQLLDRFQVRASLSLPIMIRNQLKGLLVVQQCAHSRQWKESEIVLLKQIVAELRLQLQPLAFEREQHVLSRLQEKLSLSSQSGSPFEPEIRLQTVVREVRKYLNVDRVVIGQLRSDSLASILCESKGNDGVSMLDEVWKAKIWHPQSNRYHQPIVVTDLSSDASSDDSSNNSLNWLEQFEIKACAIVPILQRQTVWGFVAAFHHSDTWQWETDEIQFLSQASYLVGTALQQAVLIAEQAKAEQYRQELPTLIEQIRHPAYLQTACQTAVQEVQRLLKVDRIAIYKFRPDYFGDFIYESEAVGFPTLVGSAWEDTYVQEHRGGRLQNNVPYVADDVYHAGLSPCHIATLEHFGVKSFAVVAIKQGETLWGLLSAFHHTGAHTWTDSEVSLLSEVGRQLGTTLQGASYLTQLQEQSDRMTQMAQISQSVNDIIPKILQSQDLDAVLQTTSQSVRRLLKCDRVALYRIPADPQADSRGELLVVSGSSGQEGLKTATDRVVWLKPAHIEPTGRYARGESLTVNNIYTSGLTDDEVECLEELNICAFVATPIIKQGELWGLLIACQNHQPRSWIEAEVEALSRITMQVSTALQQIDYLDQLQYSSNQLMQTAERSSLINKIVDRIRHSLDLQTTFKTTAKEIRNFLQVDRVAIFKFDSESSYTTGRTIAEDVQPGYVSALKVQVEDHCFNENYAEMYRKGRVWAIADIYQAGLQTCYIDVLSQFQVRANLVVPLLKGEDLWGLFCIHHCSEPREWQTVEIEFAKQIAAQLNVAIQQGEYVEQLQQQSQQLATAAQRDKDAKDTLQQEVIQLLLAVRPALEGNLTVRAPVTDDEVGTIADAYNNTLSSLQQIVVQMQAASNQVAQTSQASESAIASLAAQAQEQLQSLNQALEQVQRMVQSTHSVETYVQKVESAVQQANQTVIAGDAAMDRTVDEMQEIRDIVTETNQRLQRLSDSSQKISKVVSVISHFTTQTQLLALNAAIEATRAGEYGRGFAVVADEVRSLARQSADAAVEIEQLVQDIQASTAEVATAMENSIQQVSSGTRVASEARENLNSIVDATTQISQVVSDITQAMQQQTQQCQSMTQTMNDVAAIATKTSDDSHSISLSFKELLTLAQDLKAKSEQFTVA